MGQYDLGTARGVIEIDSSSLGRATAGLQTMGRGMVVTGAIGAAAFVGSIKGAADFERIMDAVGAVSNATDDDLKALKDTAIQLGIDTRYSATEVAQAMEDLAKAGISVEDQVNGAAEATTLLAAAAGEELPGGITQGAEIIANAMKTFDASAEDLNHFADVLVGAAQASTLNVEDLAYSLRYTGPIAHELGINLDDLSTALAILGDRGIKGSTAGTSMRGVLLSLTPTSKKAKTAMKELGYITEDGTNRFYDMNGALKPLPEVMQILKEGVEGLSEQQKVQAFNTIFQRRAMNSALILAGQGADGFEKYAKAIEKTSAADIAKKKLDNLSGSIDILKSSVEALIIKAGTPLLDMFSGWVRHLTTVVNWFAKLDEGTLTTTLAIIGIGSAVLILIGSGLLLLSLLFKMYRAFVDLKAALTLIRTVMASSFLTNPVFLVIAAIVALGVALFALYKKSATFRRIVDSMIDGIQALLKPLEPVIGAFKRFVDMMKLVGVNLQKGTLTVNNFSAWMDKAFGGGGRFVGFFRMVYEAGSKLFGWITNTAIPAARKFIDSINWEPILKVLGAALFALIAPFVAIPAAIVYAYQHFEGFRNIVQSVWAWVKDKLGPLLAELGPLFSAIGNIIAGILKRLPPIIAAAWRVIQTVFEVGLRFLVNLWKLFGDNIVNLLRTAWDLIKGIVEAGIKAITGIIQIVTGILTGDWGKVWDGIKNILAAVWDLMFRLVETAWRLIVLTVQTFFDTLHAAWDLGWDVVKNVIPAVWNAMLQIIKAVGQGIINLVKHIVEMIIAPFRWLYDTLVGHSIIPDLMEAMKDIIKDGLEAVLKFFKELPGKIVNAVGDLTLTLLGKATELIDGLYNGITSGAEKVWNFFTNLPDKMIGALGDVGGILLGVGEDIIQGLIDGIQNMVGSLSNVLGGITNLIPDWKGPADRDKQLLVRNGQLIMGGLISGLNSMVPDLFGTLYGITEGIAGMNVSASPSYYTTGGYSSGGGASVTVINQFPVVDPQDETALQSTIDQTGFITDLTRAIKAGVSNG